MADSTTGSILAEIGQLIVDSLGDYDPEGAFMYAEAGDMWQAPSIFKDLGNQVLYRNPTSELCDAIQRLWELAEPDKKWRALYYTMGNGSFDAQFKYPDELDLTESEFERSERALIERYGEKPVDYSDP